jgi:hypothetical protein
LEAALEADLCADFAGDRFGGALFAGDFFATDRFGGFVRRVEAGFFAVFAADFTADFTADLTATFAADFFGLLAGAFAFVETLFRDAARRATRRFGFFMLETSFGR